MTFSRFRSLFLSVPYCFHSEVKLVANIKSVTAKQGQGPVDEWAAHMIMDPEVSGSNLGGVKCFSTRQSFESNSSDISRFIFVFCVSSYIKLRILCGQFVALLIVLLSLCFLDWF